MQLSLIEVSPLLPLAIEIGFTQATAVHSETGEQFSAVLRKDRLSEQTFFIRIQISTPRIQGLGEPATAFPSQPADFALANFTLGTRTVIFALTPADNDTEFEYTIFEDNIPENTEIFQLSLPRCRSSHCHRFQTARATSGRSHTITFDKREIN